MANSKWLDYEGLEYYTKKLDAKLEDYAKTSDLSNYVTSSTLSTELGAYLPLTGGALTGNLTVEGAVFTAEDGHFNGGLKTDDDFTCSGKVTLGDGGPTTISAAGQVKLTLTENDSAENVVVADSSGNLYKMAASALGSPVAADGVYLAKTDVNGRNYLDSDIGDASLTVGEAVNGVFVTYQGRSLLVSPTVSSTMRWGEDGDTGGYMSTTSTEVSADFNGEFNTTAAIVSGYAKDSSYAARYCRNFKYGNIGYGEWWLPSYGECEIMQHYYSDIDTAISSCNGDSLASFGIWTSTQGAASSAWYRRFGSLPNHATYTRSSTYYVRPVSAFSYEYIV